VAVVEPVFARKITVVEVSVSRGKKYTVWLAAAARAPPGGVSDMAKSCEASGVDGTRGPSPACASGPTAHAPRENATTAKITAEPKITPYFFMVHLLE
jgi:hypothetical protein